MFNKGIACHLIARFARFSAVDCFEVGRVAYNDEDYYHTTAWMIEAMSRLENEKNKTVNKSEIIDFLAFSVYQVNL